MVTSSTTTIGPATSQVTSTNRKMNGRSVTAEIVAEVEKSRTSSIWASRWAKAPADSGRCSSRMPMAWRKMALPRARSAFLPAMSIR